MSRFRQLLRPMHAHLKTLLPLALLIPSAFGAESAPDRSATTPDSRAVLTGDQVVQILDATVDWYRTLGIQQQAATQPSDLLILYANRQTADKVIALAFEIARANAELLSSEASARAVSDDENSPQALSRRQQLRRHRLAGLRCTGSAQTTGSTDDS